MNLVLTVKVDESHAKAQRRVRDETRKSTAAGREMRQVFAKMFAGFSAAIVLNELRKIASSVIETGSRFQQLGGAVETAFGDRAEGVFADVKRFALDAPSQIGGITASWVGLKGVGIDPTAEAMMDLQDIASGTIDASTGQLRKLGDIAEAVRAAVGGETERLKQFNIQAKVDGEQITLTYDNITRTVRRSGDEILGVLQEISNARFAGAAARQMEFYAGSVSTLEDAWDSLENEIFQAGIGDLMTEAVSGTSALVTTLSPLLVSAVGDVTSSLESLKGIGDSLGDGQGNAVAFWLIGRAADVSGYSKVIGSTLQLRVALAKTEEFLKLQRQRGEEIAEWKRLSAAVDETSEATTRQASVLGSYVEAARLAEGAQLAIDTANRRALFSMEEIKDAKFADEILTQAKVWNKLLGEASPGIDVLSRLARQQIEAKEAADAHEKSLARLLEKMQDLAGIGPIRLRVELEAVDTLDVGGTLGGLPRLSDDIGSIQAMLEQERRQAAGLAAETLGEMTVTSHKIGEGWATTLKDAGAVIGQRWRELFVMVVNLIQDFGSREEGRFGGRLSGDFEDEGRQIGQIVGTIFPVIGTAVGGVIGGLLGSAIKKGADEGLGELRQVGNDAALSISTNEGGLGWVLGEIGAGFNDYLNNLESLLRGEISIGAGGIGLKVRDDLIRVFANNLTGTFESIEEATEFAIIQALRSADIQGASPEVQAALQGYAGDTLEGLDQVLALAVEFETARLGETVAAVDSSVREIFGKIGDALALGIPTEGGIAMLEQVRASLLGLEEDLVAQKDAEITAYNAALEMQSLQLQAMALEIQARGDVITAQVASTNAYADVSSAMIMSDRARIESMAGVAEAQGVMASSSAELLARIQGVLSEISGLRITGAERAAALAREAARRARGVGRRVGGGGVSVTAADPTADLREQLERLRLGSDETALALFDHEQRMASLREELNRSSLSEEERLEYLLLIQEQFDAEMRQLEADRLEAERQAAEEAIRINNETRDQLLQPYRDALSDDSVISRRDELLAQRDRDLASLEELLHTRQDEMLIIEGTEARIRELNEELASAFQGLAGSVVGFFEGAVTALPEGSKERERLEELILGYKRDQFRFELEQHRLAIAKHELELAALGMLDEEAQRYLAAMREGLDILDGSMQEIFDDMSGATEEARIAAEAAEAAAAAAAQALADARRGLDTAAGGVAGIIRQSLDSIRDPQERIALENTLIELEQRQFQLRVMGQRIELETLQARILAQDEINAADQERLAWIERFLGNLDVIDGSMEEIFESIGDEIRGAGQDFARDVRSATDAIAALPLLFPELFPVTSPPRDPADVGLQLAQLMAELFDLENPTAGLSPAERLMEMIHGQDGLAPFFEAFGLSVEGVTERLQDLIDSEAIEDAGRSMTSFIDLQRSLLPGGSLSGESDAERLISLKAQIMSAIARGDFDTAAQLGQEAISIASGVQGPWLRDLRELILSVDTSEFGGPVGGTSTGSGGIVFEGLNVFERETARRFSVQEANREILFDSIRQPMVRTAEAVEHLGAVLTAGSPPARRLPPPSQSRSAVVQ